MQARVVNMSQLRNIVSEDSETLDAKKVKLGAGLSKWSFLVRMLPCVPGMVVPDLYALAERRADQVGFSNSPLQGLAGKYACRLIWTSGG